MQQVRLSLSRTNNKRRSLPAQAHVVRCNNPTAAISSGGEGVSFPRFLLLLHLLALRGVCLLRDRRQARGERAVQEEELAWYVIRASMTTTWHLTGLEGARAPNVVPGTSSAVLDIRLSPGKTAEMALVELRALIDDETVELQVIAQEEAAVSEWRDDPFYQALSRHIQADRPDLVVGPAISPGFTDSIYLRQMGARAYGLVPFEVPQNELAGFHGPKERVSVENVDRGVRWLIGVLEETCTQPRAIESQR